MRREFILTIYNIGENVILNNSYEYTYQYEFGNRKISLVTSSPIKKSTDDVFYLLFGQYLSSDFNKLIMKNYADDIFKLIKKIRYSFLLVLIDKKKEVVYIVTDRTNTYKCFYQINHKCTVFTNSIYEINKIDKKPDSFALYTYLSSGFTYSNRTLFKNIRTIPHSTIFTYHKKELTSKKYWELTFRNEYIDTDSAIDKLYELIKDSIGFIAKNKNDLILSLSGGHDISAILGIASTFIRKKKIAAVSYYYGNLDHVSDSRVAEEQSKLLDIRFFRAKSFSGDFKFFLDGNAFWGNGISNICEEVEFWSNIKNSNIFNENSIFIFGDEFFGQKYFPFMTWNNMFNTIKMARPSIEKNKTLKRIWDHFELNIAETFDEVESFERTQKNLLKNIQHKGDVLNYLYYEHRLTNIMTSWREYFPGRFFYIANPLISNDIIDFITQINFSHRSNKKLFIKMCYKKLPTLFKINRAKKNNTIHDWQSILESNYKYIIDNYLEELTVNQLLGKNSNSSIKNKLIKLPIFNFREKDINGIDLLKRILIVRKIYE